MTSTSVGASPPTAEPAVDGARLQLEPPLPPPLAVTHGDSVFATCRSALRRMPHEVLRAVVHCVAEASAGLTWPPMASSQSARQDASVETFERWNAERMGDRRRDVHHARELAVAAGADARTPEHHRHMRVFVVRRAVCGVDGSRPIRVWLQAHDELHRQLG